MEKKLQAKGIGKFIGQNSYTPQGKIVIEDVMYIPELTVNLLSVTQMISKGWCITGDSLGFSLQMEGRKILFNKKYHQETDIY